MNISIDNNFDQGVTITLDPSPKYIIPDDYYNPRRNEVIYYGKSYLPYKFEEQIKEQLVRNNGCYNSVWNEILKSYQLSESFIREILEYIDIDFLIQYQSLSEDFKRELKDKLDIYGE